MDKFTVPQFIDVEDKILGPITVRQFVILMVGVLMIFVGYKLLTFMAFIVWFIFWFLFIGIVGFMRVNGMPFHFFLLNMIESLRRTPLRVWNKQLSLGQIKQLAYLKPDIEVIEKIPVKARVSRPSLTGLALIADTGGTYQGESEQGLAAGQKISGRNEGGAEELKI